MNEARSRLCRVLCCVVVCCVLCVVCCVSTLLVLHRRCWFFCGGMPVSGVEDFGGVPNKDSRHQ